jgi:hypothetical protein
MRARAVVPILLATELAACGGRVDADQGSPEPSDASTIDASASDSGALAFPVGTYAHCARGSYTVDGSSLNTVGFVEDAVLVVKQNGTTLTADYVDANGETQSFDFALATDTLATLSPAGQTVTGFTGLCVLGIGYSNEQPYGAELSATTGALSYDSGAVFITMAGSAEGDGGECGPTFTTAGVWFVCDDGPSSEPIDDAAPSLVPDFPVGSYACSSQIGTYYESGGTKQFVASGSDKGTLTLTQTGSDVTAAYSADSFITGTLHFAVTTATTAKAAAGQSLTTPCEVPVSVGGPPPSQTPETLPLAAGSLMLDGSMLFLPFTGAMDPSSSCAGAQKAGSLICAKK